MFEASSHYAWTRPSTPRIFTLVVGKNRHMRKIAILIPHEGYGDQECCGIITPVHKTSNSESRRAGSVEFKQPVPVFLKYRAGVNQRARAGYTGLPGMSTRAIRPDEIPRNRLRHGGANLWLIPRRPIVQDPVLSKNWDGRCQAARS